jgi:hypothetical protein
MPAITATFRADVTQFRQALEQANTVVTGFSRTTAQVNRDLQRFGNDFSGAKVIREAETAAKAVEQIGGAARLTESEHRRLNATLQEALSKYQALGQEAPESLKRIATETKHAVEAADDLKRRNKESGDSLISLGGIAGKVGPALAGMFTVGAVTAFANEILDLGGQINDLSARTGLGVEAVQELKFAADQTGTSIDVVSGSINKLGDGLAEGSKTTRAAVKDLGLSFNELRNSSPEEAFTAVTAALKDIPDEMQRVNLGRELLGRGFDQMLPAIREGFSELRQQARDTGQVLSEDNVKALADFGDQWDATMTRIKGSTASAVLDIGRGFGGMFADLKSGLDDLVPDGLVALVNNPTVRWLIEKSARGLAAQPIFGGGIVNVLMDAQARGSQERGQAGLERLRDQILRDRANTSGDVPRTSGGDVEALTAEAKAIKALADTLTGADIAAKLKQLDAAWKEVTKSGNANEAAVKRLVTVYADLRQRSGFKDLPSDLERVHSANLPVIEDTRQLIDITGRYATATLPDLSRRTAEARALMQGFNRDGLIPVTKSFADLSATNMIPWPVDGIKNVGDQIKVVYEGTNDWTGALDDAARAFSQLGQIRPLEGPLADFAELINLMNVGSQMAGGLATAFRAPRRDENGDVITDINGTPQFSNFSFDNFTGANGTEAQIGAYVQTAQIAIAASQGQTAVLRATDAMGRGNRALRGAAAGAAEGGQFGPYGAAGGAVIGALIGALRNPAFEDVFHRVAKNFGVSISEETSRAIADLAKAKFGKDRAAAEIFSLDTIIAEGGGLKDSNIDKMTDRLRDVFVMLGTGKFTAEQATDALDRSFGAFAEHIRKSESIASKAFQDVIKLNEQMGTDSEQIRQFVEGQTAALGGGVAALAGPLLEQSNKLKAEIDRALQDQKSAGTDVGAYEAASGRLATLLAQQKDLAAGSAEEFERLGVIAVGAFNASVAAGTDLITAVEALGPGLDTLLQIQKDLGIETQNAGLAELAQFRERVNANQALVAGTAALGETLRALTSIGGLTNETLAAMEAQGVQTFDRLIAAGFTENQALAQMKGFLLNVLEGHEQLGTPIDENTQKLIDQAREAGILKGKTKDSTKVMEEGFDKVVAAVGLLTKALGQDVPAAIQETIDKLDEIPRDIQVGVDVVYNDPGHSPNVGSPDGSDLPGAAGGIYATGSRGVATWFGEGGRPELGGPVDFMGDVLARAARQNDIDLGALARSRYGDAGSRPMIGQLVVGGRVIAEAVMRETPNVARQWGIR